MTALLAKSCGPVRVNAVAPGLVATPWTSQWPDQHAAVAATTPMHASATPEDCAEAVLGSGPELVHHRPRRRRRRRNVAGDLERRRADRLVLMLVGMTEPSAELSRAYDGDLRTLRQARPMSIEWLSAQGADEGTQERAALIVSELCSNAIQNSSGSAYTLKVVRVDDSRDDHRCAIDPSTSSRLRASCGVRPAICR